MEFINHSYAVQTTHIYQARPQGLINPQEPQVTVFSPLEVSSIFSTPRVTGFSSSILLALLCATAAELFLLAALSSDAS